MKIALNKVHFPVTVLGPGRRIGIWLQGCSIGCRGCVSQDTWAIDPNREMDVEALLDWCRETAGENFDGVTISGGEPFDQPIALRALLEGLHGWRRSVDRQFDILCYSGYPLRTLLAKQSVLLALLDALIAEPYVESLPMTDLWRGSANQSLTLLSPLGEQRFEGHLVAPLLASEKRIQVTVEAQHVWYIGVPSRGDMEALEKACAARGVEFGQVSWRN